jgi:mevalonate kinase
MNEYSAPAKIILCGEHAVVYGQPAIAVPVTDLRVYARVIPGGQQLQIVSEPKTDEGIDSDNGLLTIATYILELLKAVPPKVTIAVRSSIPIASGLGSGAAIATVLTRALAVATQTHLSIHDVNAIVYEVEKIFHGTPSGIDNTVIVYEKPVYFVKDETIQPIIIGGPLHLLIGDTGVRSLTKTAVADVRHLYEAQPEQIQLILNEIGELVKAAHSAIKAGDSAALGYLMNQNHTLLQSLSVSSPELDHLVQTANDNGALGAKLSGGGRGGNMIALVTPATLNSVRAALIQAGAVRVFQTYLS